MLKIVVLKLTKVLLDVEATVYGVVKAVIQNLFGHYVIKYDLFWLKLKDGSHDRET